MAKMIGAFAMSFTISGFSAPAADKPRNTSAPFNASVSVRRSVAAACADCHWLISSRPW